MAERVERRRMPRITVPGGELCQVAVRHRVQLLDISQSGALLACETTLPLGLRGQFRASLTGLPFSADVAVRRHHLRHAQRPPMGLGTMFADMDERSRRHLGQFLQRGRNGGH